MLEGKTQNEKWTLCLEGISLTCQLGKSTLSPNHQSGLVASFCETKVWSLLAAGYWTSPGLFPYKKTCSLKNIVDYIFLQQSKNALQTHSTVPKGLQAQGTCARIPMYSDWSGEKNNVYMWLEWWRSKYLAVYFYLALVFLLVLILKQWKVNCNNHFSSTIGYIRVHIYLWDSEQVSWIKQKIT